MREVKLLAISYLKLREILREREIQNKALKVMAKISHDTIAKISKDKFISLESLEKIARALDAEIGDIISLKD
jgi:putative transcriptional regulator